MQSWCQVSLRLPLRRLQPMPWRPGLPRHGCRSVRPASRLAGAAPMLVVPKAAPSATDVPKSELPALANRLPIPLVLCPLPPLPRKLPRPLDPARTLASMTGLNTIGSNAVTNTLLKLSIKPRQFSNPRISASVKPSAMLSAALAQAFCASFADSTAALMTPPRSFSPASSRSSWPRLRYCSANTVLSSRSIACSARRSAVMAASRSLACSSAFTASLPSSSAWLALRCACT